jgi:hypothetical protein
VYTRPVRIETDDLGHYQVNLPTTCALLTRCGTRDVLASPSTAAIYRPDQETVIEGLGVP